MDEQAQAVGVRRRRTRAEVEQLAAAYEVSGLSQVEFCRERGLSLSTLARYRKRRVQGQAAPGSRWVAVEVSSGDPGLGIGASGSLAVALPNGRRVEVRRGFDASTLIQLLSVLERV